MINLGKTRNLIRALLIWMDIAEQLQGTEIPERLGPILQKYEVTTHDILTRSIKDLVGLTSMGTAEVSIHDYIKLKKDLSRSLDKLLENGIRNPASMDSKSFTTGSYHLDCLLRGGIRVGHVTEVSGESSTGKTQLLLQLTLSCQIPENLGGLGSESCAFFVATEAPMPVNRLAQLLEENYAKSEIYKKQTDSRPSLDRVFTRFISNWAREAEFFFFYQLPQILSSNNRIRLVVIDSIAHHLRSGIQGKTTSEDRWESKLDHSMFLSRLYSHLQSLAEKHSIAVVFSNQVTSVPPRPQGDDLLAYDRQLGWLCGWSRLDISADRQSNSHMKPSPKREYIIEESKTIAKEHDGFQMRTAPCLGLAWANRIPTRLVLSSLKGEKVAQRQKEIALEKGRAPKRRRIKDRKYYFVTVANSIFGNTGFSTEAKITKRGYRGIGN